MLSYGVGFSRQTWSVAVPSKLCLSTTRNKDDSIPEQHECSQNVMKVRVAVVNALDDKNVVIVCQEETQRGD